MSTQVWLSSPGVAMESTINGVGAAIQSSYLVALTVDMGTSDISDGGPTVGATSRQIRFSEVLHCIANIVGYMEKNNFPPVSS